MKFSKKQLKQTFVAAPLLAVTLLLAGCPSAPMPAAVDTPVAEVSAGETPVAETPTAEAVEETPVAETPTAEAAEETPVAEEAAEGEIPVITIEIGADALTFPAEVPSGIVSFEVESADGPEGFPDIVRLNDGVTMDQFMAAMQEDFMGALALAEMIGATQPGVEVVYDLEPGDYVAVLLHDGPPVVGSFVAGEPSGAAAPEADFTAQLADFAFIIPDSIPTGPHTWHIENVGEQWHEMLIMQLPEGTTVEDLLAILAEQEQAGPPPFDMVNWWAPMGAGKQAWFTWDLPAGEYTVICFLPDIAGDMAPHAAHGMVRTLTVTE